MVSLENISLEESSEENHGGKDKQKQNGGFVFINNKKITEDKELLDYMQDNRSHYPYKYMNYYFFFN